MKILPTLQIKLDLQKWITVFDEVSTAFTSKIRTEHTRINVMWRDIEEFVLSSSFWKINTLNVMDMSQLTLHHTGI